METEIDRPFPVTACGTCRIAHPRGRPEWRAENCVEFPETVKNRRTSDERNGKGRRAPGPDGVSAHRGPPPPCGAEGADGPGAWQRAGAINPGEVICYCFGAPTGFPSGVTAYQVPPTP
ncbi:hypothetical protein GCM10018783_08060 [Streptomyces griseosporeus]|nr:hypothetical protein GCM10018783_08060 [Streptomyces griseosporeus]